MANTLAFSEPSAEMETTTLKTMPNAGPTVWRANSCITTIKVSSACSNGRLSGRGLCLLCGVWWYLIESRGKDLGGPCHCYSRASSDGFERQNDIDGSVHHTKAGYDYDHRARNNNR